MGREGGKGIWEVEGRCHCRGSHEAEHRPERRSQLQGFKKLLAIIKGTDNPPYKNPRRLNQIGREEKLGK